MMSNHDDKSTLPGLTTEIVTAYLRNHPMAAVEVPILVATVARELGGLGREPAEPAQPAPAVSIRRSVQRDYLVCLICGRKLKSLRRHLAVAHDLTSAGYRETFGLKRDYPIVAPAYAEQRVAIARRSGLGLRRAPEPALTAEQAAGPEPSPEPPPPEPTRAQGDEEGAGIGGCHGSAEVEAREAILSGAYPGTAVRSPASWLKGAHRTRAGSV